MIESQVRAVAIEQESHPAPSIGLVQATVLATKQVGAWAGDTAQQFGTLVAILMGPAVFSAYAFAAWALSANLGWTDTFLFTSGAMSNWIVWLGIAVLVNTAASILKKHTRLENK